MLGQSKRRNLWLVLITTLAIIAFSIAMIWNRWQSIAQETIIGAYEETVRANLIGMNSVMQKGKIPDIASLGLYIPKNSLNQILESFNSTQFRVNENQTIELVNAVLITRVGEVQILLEVLGRDRKTNLAISLEVSALLSQPTLRVSDKERSTLELGIIPMSIRPKLSWRNWRLLTAGGLGQVVSSEAIKQFAGSIKLLIPIEDRFEARIPDKTRFPIEVGKAKLTLEISTNQFPPYIVQAGLEPTITTEDGLWILVQKGEVTPPQANSNISLVDLRKQATELLKGVTNPKGKVQLWMSSNLAKEIFGDLQSLVGAQKQASIQTVEYDGGKLFEENWSDNVLGKGGYFGEFPRDNLIRGNLLLSTPQQVWEAGKGIRVSTRVAVSAQAAVHVHFDPLIGGGVGTVVGINGEASSELQALIGFRLESVSGIPTVIAEPKLGCSKINAEIKTSDTVRFFNGRVKLFSIGLRTELPLPDPDPAILLNGQPTTTEISVENIIFPNKYIQIQTIPTRVEVLETGLVIEINFQTSWTNQPAIIQDLTKLVAKPSPCETKTNSALVLGSLEISESNEVLKAINTIVSGVKDIINGAGDIVGNVVEEGGRFVRLVEKTTDDVIVRPAKKIERWVRKRLGF